MNEQNNLSKNLKKKMASTLNNRLSCIRMFSSMAFLPANVPFSCQDQSHPTPSHVLPLKWRQEQLLPGKQRARPLHCVTGAGQTASCPTASYPASPPALCFSLGNTFPHYLSNCPGPSGQPRAPRSMYFLPLRASH